MTQWIILLIYNCKGTYRFFNIVAWRQGIILGLEQFLKAMNQ